MALAARRAQGPLTPSLPRMKPAVNKWLHGLIGGFVGGFAGAIDSALALMVVDPKEFNVGPGLVKTLETAVILGILVGLKVAFAYLKQSPLPPEDDSTKAN